MKAVLLLISFYTIISTQQVYAENLKLLGQRDASCSKETVDSYELKIPESLKSETQTLASQDQLKQLVVPSPNCFRVGTEAKIFLENTEVSLLGRGFISSIEILSKNELLKKKLNYSPKILNEYIKQIPSANYAVLNIDVSEKVTESFVNTKYKRLPTCFPTYGDWETYLLPEQNGAELAEKIKKGKIKAQIGAGTFNCYKIGASALIIDSKGQANDFGSILPTELYLVHYTNLNQKHADLLGENLSQLKKRMTESKDKDGGYTNIVVFDYIQPEPANPTIR